MEELSSLSRAQQIEADAAEWLSTREAGAILKLSVSALQQWRYKGIGPPYLKLASGAVGHRSGAVRYKRSELIKWLESRQIVPEFEREISPVGSARIARRMQRLRE